jgi:hypothetical protein
MTPQARVCGLAFDATRVSASLRSLDWEADEFGADLRQPGGGRTVVGRLVQLAGLAVAKAAAGETFRCLRASRKMAVSAPRSAAAGNLGQGSRD